MPALCVFLLFAFLSLCAETGQRGGEDGRTFLVLFNARSKSRWPLMAAQLFGDSSALRTSFETHFDFHGQLRLSRALKVGTELFFVLVSPPA